MTEMGSFAVGALPIEHRAFGVLEWLESEYPGFDDWYWSTVVPGIDMGGSQG